MVMDQPAPTLEANYFEKYPEHVFDHPIPYFTSWLFNYLRYGHFPADEKELPNENFKMADLPSIFEAENFVNFKENDFIEDCFSKHIFLSSFFGVGEPENNYEEKTTELPAIFDKTEPNSTSLEFAHVPKGACSSKKKIIALVKTSFLDSGTNGGRRKSLRGLFAKMMNPRDYELFFLVGSEFRPKRSLGDSGGENFRIKYTAHDGLAEEIKNFDDLIVGKFEDNYENLPVKTFLG